MEKLLETWDLPKLNEEEAESLKRTITASEGEAVIKTLPSHKIPGPDSFLGDHCKIFRKKVNPYPPKTIPKTQDNEYA